MEEIPTVVIVIRKLNKTTGAARIALQQISILKNIGYNVTVICEKANKEIINSYGGELKTISKLPLNSFLRRLWFNLLANLWCFRHKPSLIISHGDMDNADIIYMHNCVDLAQEIIYPNLKHQQPDVSKIHHRILNKSNYRQIVANSQLMRNDFISRYAIPSEKISVSYPGYDALQFNTSVKTNFSQKKRGELNIKDHEKLIGLITSGDFKKRNLSFFIEIANQLLKNSDIQYRFLIIGQGNIAPYQEKTTNLGIEKYFTWKKTVPDVEHYYVALDLFVLPAHIEEFGCVVLEAMACSTPVLISERVGAGELLQGDLKNLIVKGYNSEDWAHRIEHIVNNDVKMINNQLIETSSQYTYSYQHEKLKELILKNI
ncbi:glycosyltransferase family 4 protein [Halomonas sp. SpR8]|uniref:glycosyltransferase family 4 protein n=1 Tax=Halomonas sp. SpR8 TaxID=3050463 RepID=UPI0027E4BE3D|nr:glycosyltransferase family 4 protein [Halomonas sp. SpR8]MDQ7730446.1 glycosyltransferase family 4 protein [Halomonas sp. SpR8]